MTAAGTRYGLPVELWEATKQEIVALLQPIAARGTTITYGDLVLQVKSAPLAPSDSRLNAMLVEISKSEDGEGRGMLSAVVVTQKTGIPGDGFFALAYRLGRNTSNPFACWKAEHDRVCGFWTSHRVG